MTIGGLHGTVDSIDESKVVIKTGDNTRLTFDRRASEKFLLLNNKLYSNTQRLCGRQTAANQKVHIVHDGSFTLWELRYVPEREK